MIPVVDATGSDLSPSGLAGFIGPIKRVGPTPPAQFHRET